jgi:hypothetical protein
MVPGWLQGEGLVVSVPLEDGWDGWMDGQRRVFLRTQRLKVDGPGMLQKAELAVDCTRSQAALAVLVVLKGAGRQATEDRAFSREKNLLPETSSWDFIGEERCFSGTALRKIHCHRDGSRP